jgi:hypothetical protein
MGLEIAALAYLSLAATAVSAGVSMYGQHQQAKSATQAAKYNNENAVAEATNLQNESREAQKRERQRNRRQMAHLRLNLAGQGTLSSTGTPLAILSESQENFSLGIADAARRTDIQAASLRSAGQMGLWEAQVNKNASRLRMASTALNGFSNTYATGSTLKYEGAFG